MEIRPLEIDASPAMAEAARVRARTGRGTGGKTWWSRQWMTGVQEACPRQVMDNGRRDAKRGRIVSLLVRPGAVCGESRTEDEPAVHPRISVQPVDALQVTAISAELARAARYPADLLAGQVPQDLPELFARHGARFMPEAPGEPMVTCDCHEEGPWCRHVAALALVLAEQLDADPFLILVLRGLDRDELLATWRRAWGAPALRYAPAPAADPDTAADAQYLQPGPPPEFTSGPGEFFRLQRALPPPFIPADEDDQHPAVIELLGFPPFFPAGDRTVLQTLENMYDDA